MSVQCALLLRLMIAGVTVDRHANGGSNMSNRDASAIPMKKMRTLLLSGASALTAGALVSAVMARDVPAPDQVSPPTTQNTPEQKAATLFDPQRHMHVSEVRPGMKGYGLSVFSGTELTKFDVEVVDVVKNFNMKYDVVLIMCKGDYLQHTGSIAGMSGSPIYLYGADGKPRMIGAFAYGWSLSKDPLAGVQPIEYMLALPGNDHAKPAETLQTQTNAGGSDQSPPLESTSLMDARGRLKLSPGKPVWSIDDVRIPGWKPYGVIGTREQRGSGELPAESHTGADQFTTSSRLTIVDGQQVQLVPLATPLMARGFSPDGLAQLKPMLAGSGLVPLEIGGGGGNDAAAGAGDRAGANDPKMEPGGVLAVPVLTGDLELTAIGTVTEVIGDRVFGFGHPFNNEGAISIPMGTGKIATVVASLQESFKLGYMTKTLGTLTTDQTVGVAGRVGNLPAMIPIELHVIFADKSVDRTYHFHCVQHAKFTPQIAPGAIAAAVEGEKGLPTYHTLDYDVLMEFANGEKVHLLNTSTNQGVQEMGMDIALPIGAGIANPFERVPVTKITGTVTVTEGSRAAEIVSVGVPRTKYQPGETVKAFVTYKPFRAREATFPIEMDLPRDLPNGAYQFSVSDASRYAEEERQMEPFKFGADDSEDMFNVIRAVTSIRRDAVYIRLMRQPDGVAVGRSAMPRLPSSRRQVLLDANRSDTTPYVTSNVKILPTDLVMEGGANFTITIERKASPEAAAKPPKAAEPDHRVESHSAHSDAEPSPK